MTATPDRQLLGEAAHVIRDAICRMNVSGEQIPRRWPNVLGALKRRVAEPGQPDTPDLPRLKTAREVATEQRCSTRTARRRIKAAGGRKIDGLGWIVQED